MNDVSRKFYKDPEEVPDLSRDDFVSRQIVLKQTEGIREMWTPILYMYEVRFLPLFRCSIASRLYHHQTRGCLCLGLLV